ncbi:MAG: hypothetical protein J6P03_06125 [Opitutales bacterium]|nr:hypothetical protein [Opitutales bacterium]
MMIKKLALISAALLSLASSAFADWANYKRYNADDKRIIESGNPPVAVFMGDSITDGWAHQSKEFFKDNNYAGRGISGQVTAQMLARFRADVIDLRPKTVLILAGTNDLAQNQGPVELENIAGNIISMAELARINGIVPVICSITPAAEYPWRKQIENVGENIEKINKMLKDYCDKNRVIYLDYHSKLANAEKGLDKDLSGDGVHPTLKYYKIMEAMAKDAVEKAVKQHQKFGRGKRRADRK